MSLLKPRLDLWSTFYFKGNALIQRCARRVWPTRFSGLKGTALELAFAERYRSLQEAFHGGPLRQQESLLYSKNALLVRILDIHFQWMKRWNDH